MSTSEISLNSYLGQKGYTLLKKELTSEQCMQIKKELIAKPLIQSAAGFGQTTISFPIYRESPKKLYLPRYYGENKFGKPKTLQISEGEPINITFSGELRENQKPVVDTYLCHVLESQHGGGLLELFCGAGKTVIGLYICAQLKKKTLIIVHKEFLLNQWIERIKEYLPYARVGRIQAQIIDIEDKDIVIGMLQSLSMKDYPESMFSSFGFTIIDEVHHISSEVFSQVLFKIVTKYTLGLSATMERKDGTTNVFKMFLGDILYKSKQEVQHNVVVRAIEYISNDEEFNEVPKDYRGNVQYSTLISKLCEYNRRSEFILKLLKDMIEENSKQQIMIIAHNKNLLKYLYDAIEHRNIASVGYYIGGMKEKALKESECKMVIIATYSMAAEALDIKTLTTLIMATPKTDIEQAVGRILRDKHCSPIVVDIIDKHNTLQNQWRKRKTFYKKQNYRIIGTNNLEYENNNSKWKVIYDSNKINKMENENEEMKPIGKCLLKICKK
jgi:superfamily II DNA or RNA helicase